MPNPVGRRSVPNPVGRRSVPTPIGRRSVPNLRHTPGQCTKCGETNHVTATCRHAKTVVCRKWGKLGNKDKHRPRDWDFRLQERATDLHSNLFGNQQQHAITVTITETRPRARQKRSVDNIGRVPTVKERLRWDLPCIINLNARSISQYGND